MRSIPTIIVMLAVFALSACGGADEKPDYLWEEEKFIEVLTEFQMAEGMVRLRYNLHNDSIYDNDSLYNSLFSSLGVSEAEFDSNYYYHLRDPKHMEEIYDKVITRLSERSAGLESN